MTEEQFDKLMHDACEAYMNDEVKKYWVVDTAEIPECSRRFKVKMNRLFRERVGGKYIPHPEVDNWFERVRSQVVIRWSAWQDKKKPKYKC